MERKMKSIADITKDEYLGPLLFSYIETILRSGELLEDDFQAVLSVYRPENFCVKKKRYVPYGLVASTSTLLPAAVAAKKFGSLLFMVPSSILTTGVACYTYFQTRKRKHDELLISRLIQILKDVQQLNKRIDKYLQERQSHSNKYLREFFQPFSRVVIDFVKALSKRQFDFHHMIISHLFFISNFCDPIKDDCSILKDYQPANLTNLLQGDLENYMKYTTDVINVQQLLTSKLLSYLAIIWSYEESRFGHEQVGSLMDGRIPHLIKMFSSHYQITQDMFYSLRYSVVRFSEVKLEKRIITKDRVSAKLRHALDTSVNSLCFVLEKLYNIIGTIEEADEVVDTKLIDKGLIDLKSHVAATYEALDILCKLYGIMAEPKMLQAPPPSNEQSTENETLYRLQFLDEQNPRELIEDKEKYELYLQVAESVEDFSPIYEEASDTYLKLMIQELKQNLYQHEFYVAARERWRDQSEEEAEEQFRRTFNRQNSVHELSEAESVTGSESPSEEENSSEEVEDTENDETVRVREPQPNDVGETGVAKDTSNFLGNVGLVSVHNNIRAVPKVIPAKEPAKIDTLTRNMENHEKAEWNPIVQGVKGLAQNIKNNEETFGGDGDSD